MKRITLICGHYGSGKTNLALNMALEAAKSGEKITLVDLDIVNPYFRTVDYTEVLEKQGINVIAQNLEGTTVDAPALTARMFSIFDESMGRVIVDVGGDDVGATALGRFAQRFNESGYDMLYVINRNRKFISEPDEAASLLGEIETACRLKATALVNNSHLGPQTTAQDVIDSVPYAKAVSKVTGLPLLMTTAPKAVCDEIGDRVDNLYPVDVVVRLPWDN
ncbi:MAG: ParA family protein [Clostridia bacterium]|nr:ParA family protein [Clostridia bacterium]